MKRVSIVNYRRMKILESFGTNGKNKDDSKQGHALRVWLTIRTENGGGFQALCVRSIRFQYHSALDGGLHDVNSLFCVTDICVAPFSVVQTWYSASQRVEVGEIWSVETEVKSLI